MREKMELSRREAPLYGQVEAHAMFQDPVIDSEDTEFYVVVEGSRLTHVTVAKRRSDGLSLCFTVPGHDLPEVVSVTSYLHAEDRVKPCGVGASLEYVSDVAQEVADYLSVNRYQLSPQSYLEVLKRLSTWVGGWDKSSDHDTKLCPGHSVCDDEDIMIRSSPDDEAGLRELDEKITHAMANMDYPEQWENRKTQPNEVAELHPRETLLHLAVRLDLLHLSQFLIHQPRGQRALTLPNQEGDTPLQLAQKGREHTLFRMLAARPVPAVCPVAGVRCVWCDGSGVLRFCPGTDSLTLTVQRVPGGCHQDSIMLLRDKLRDDGILEMITVITGDNQVDDSGKEEANDGVREELVVEQRVPTDNGVDADARCHVSGVTSDSTGTDCRARDAGDSEVPLLATDTPPPRRPFRLEGLQPPSHPLSAPVSPSRAPGDQVLTSPDHSVLPDLTDQRESPPLETCDLSPSLVALEVDSEEDSAAAQSTFPTISSDIQTSGETFDPSPDLTCTRTQSASTASDLTSSKVSAFKSLEHSNEMDDQGIRLRSYSYSSPKVNFRPARFARDNPTPDLSPDGVFHNVFYNRSLLQALSLSKSLSLLHPGKQRASSLPEQPQEKREIRFRKRAQSADDEGNMELAESLQHLTLSEFLKEIEEEEFDKYNIPSKVESEKYKVIRTFSFLKSRMSSTRNKNKGKGKDREAKDRQLNGHRFSSGSCVGSNTCLVCDKPASGKDLLHCSSCTVMVHKACKESAPPCLKKLQDKYAVTMVKNRTASLPQNFTVRDSPPQCVVPISASLPVMAPRKDPVSSPLSGSFPNTSDRLSEGSETESDSWRILSQSEELQQAATSSTSTDSSLGEDCVDAYVHSDPTSDAADYEAESWSLTVEHKFCKKQEKRVVKRQDVIYELMQTEVHHLQTLHIMAEVFRRGMREEVQLDAEAVDRVFPCLDQLIFFHHAFFAAMRERRHSSAQPQGQRNYLIRQIGDVLLQQFSDENAEKMKQVYGEFCSHHNEAVSFFKELQQHNKRFQNFIKQQSNNSLVRRKEIPECILLVTQRITKYPVLLERIIQYTQEDTQEHADLSKALVQIREVIAAVDLWVNEYERDKRLQEVWNRMENRTSAKLKNGHTFRKQDMMGPGQRLKHQGTLMWKTATGRLKDVLALLLTDTLIFLQEKDQKYMFATVDQKPPVISLQKLIVREVANEERGMFLISASAAGPEMYEVHSSSKDDRNSWMRLIREAVESCPEEEEEYTSESEEEKRAAETRIQKIHKLQESLMSQDQQICSSLEEKLQIYAELSTMSWRMTAPQLEPRLLVQTHSEDVPQASVLLAAALQEAENLRATLSPRACSPSSPSQDSGRTQDSDSVFPDNPFVLLEPPPDCEAREGGWPEALALKSLPHLQKGDPDHINLKVAQSVQSLTQLLYSLQAAVTIQDSCYEVQRLLLCESGRPSPRSHRPQPPSVRGHTLQEQEKQRNLEKQREEVAAAQRLQGQLRQERQRWEKECQARQSQQGELESRLEERERQCRLEADRLRQEREQLEEQLEEYQQSLERLREGQRSVEREREKLETQQKLLQSWRHSRQRSLPVVIPAMVIPLDGQQVSVPDPSRDHVDDGSVFVNEAAFTSPAINNRHLHHKGNDPSAHNCLNTLLARSSHRQNPVAKTPQPHTDLQGWPMGTGYFYTPRLGLEQTPNDLNAHSYIRDQGSGMPPTATGADQFPGLPHPSDPQLDLGVLVSLETESGEEGREENIVYL
ncbi:rho guanine nucleotide exchange factor 28 [Polymixia lowei]